jgi:AcrR family transcriptional regulator
MTPPMLDLHDVPGPALSQVRQRRLAHPQRTEEVRLQLGARLFLGELLEKAVRRDAGVVDHDVQADLRGRPAHRAPHGGAVGDVERQHEQLVAVFGRQVVQPAGRPRGRRDPVSPGQRGAGELETEASRSAILDAALELATELGYQKLTIEAVAGRAGVGKQTIYRWWPSKGAVLFDALLARAQEGDGDGALPDTGDLAADLRSVLRATVAEFADPAFAGPIRALTVELAQDPDLAEQYQQRLDRPMRELKKARLRAAQDAGELRADADLDVLADLLFTPIAQRWLLRTGPLTPDYADAVVDHALHGQLAADR